MTRAAVTTDRSETCAACGRGVETFNAAWGLMDLTPRGRQEDELPFPMAWLRRHDEY